jgi:hypothetical protein
MGADANRLLIKTLGVIITAAIITLNGILIIGVFTGS